jgi:hypothetical protein
MGNDVGNHFVPAPKMIPDVIFHPVPPPKVDDRSARV